MNKHLSLDFCNIVKFLACWMIFFEHICFIFNNHIWEYLRLGYLGCVLFFFLSSYGIVFSLTSKPMKFVAFVRKRLLKLWIPLVCINVLFVCYSILVNKGMGFYECHATPPLLRIQTSESFHNLPLYLIDILYLDPVTWFLHELIFGYVIIWLLMQFKSVRRRILLMFVVYLLFESFFYYFKISQLYKINTVGLLLGFCIANVEPFLKTTKEKHTFLISLLFFSIVKIVTLIWASSFYGIIMDMINILLASIFTMSVYFLGRSLTFKSKVFGTLLGGLSYYVYLVHMKVVAIMDTSNVFHLLITILMCSLVLYKFVNLIVKRVV